MPFQPSEMTGDTLRRFVDNLARRLKAHPLPTNPKRSQLQEAVAVMLGWPSYHAAITTLSNNASSAAQPSVGQVLDWQLSSEIIEYLNLPKKWFNSEDAIIHKIPAEQFAVSVLFQANEKVRQVIIREMLKHNQGLPLCIVKGPMSTLSDLVSSDIVSDQSALNILDTGSASEITDMIVGLMGSGGGDADMWRLRAVSLLSSVVYALVSLRKINGAAHPLTISSLIDGVGLDRVLELSRLDVLPPFAIQSLNSYLRSLPGYKEEQASQPSVVLEQHGYLQMQLTPLFEKLQSEDVRLLQRRASLNSNQLDVHLPERSISAGEVELIKRDIQSWVDRNPGGLVLFDVIPLESDLWPWLTNRVSHWLDRQIAVWVGVHTKDDIPRSTQLSLIPRLQHRPE